MGKSMMALRNLWKKTKTFSDQKERSSQMDEVKNTEANAYYIARVMNAAYIHEGSQQSIPVAVPRLIIAAINTETHVSS
jgi:hypothetical protein